MIWNCPEGHSVLESQQRVCPWCEVERLRGLLAQAKEGAKMNLRQLANGKPCMVRLPCCDGGGETTVLAHYRLAGTCGMGMKPPDILGAWACSHCHDVCDGRGKAAMSRSEARLAHAEGVLRTLCELEKLGVLKH